MLCINNQIFDSQFNFLLYCLTILICPLGWITYPFKFLNVCSHYFECIFCLWILYCKNNKVINAKCLWRLLHTYPSATWESIFLHRVINFFSSFVEPGYCILYANQRLFLEKTEHAHLFDAPCPSCEFPLESYIFVILFCSGQRYHLFNDKKNKNKHTIVIYKLEIQLMLPSFFLDFQMLSSYHINSSVNCAALMDQSHIPARHYVNWKWQPSKYIFGS